MIEFGHSTHVGLRREHNEDTYYADSDLGLWLVADGMGGHENGEVASALARDTLVREIKAGKVEFRVDKTAIIHAPVGKVSFSADAHYHHLTDDVIEGGLMSYENGCIRVPDGPGLGIKLDRDKLRQYHELYLELGSYAYDRDPGRPDWFALVPNDRWADPSVSLTPKLL